MGRYYRVVAYNIGGTDVSAFELCVLVAIPTPGAVLGETFPLNIAPANL